MWHSLIGYGEDETNEVEVEKRLKDNSLFARRVLATDEGLFFGEAKELLLAVAKRLAEQRLDAPRPDRALFLLAVNVKSVFDFI